MTDEVTFIDLAVLLKITPNTPLEKLGGLINASIFDASNLAGGLKQKGLIEFTAYYPGPNSMTITEVGKTLITEADSRAMEPTDQLDDSILKALSGGKRSLVDLQNGLNLRSKDLALRLYKENKQGLLTYELKNGTIDLMLTENGFLHAKGGGAQQPAATASVAPASPATPGTTMPTVSPMPQPVPTVAAPTAPAAAPAAAPPAPGAAPAPAKPPKAPMKMKPMIMIAAVVVVIVVVLVVLHFELMLI